MKKIYSFLAVILSVLFFSQGYYAFAVTKVFKTGAPSTAGLVSYYQFENITSDFFGTNTLANNGVTTSTGKVVTDGAAFAADGGATNTSANASSSSNFGITGGSISMACWINVTTAPAGFEVYAGQAAGSPIFVEYMLSYRTQAGVKKVQWHRNRYNVADDTITTSTTLTPGTWYFLALTYSSTSTILTGYLNGLVQGSTTASGNGVSFATDGVAFLSRSTPNDDSYASGLVDECPIYNIELSATDISNLYNSGTGQTMITQTAGAVLRRRIYIIQ